MRRTSSTLTIMSSTLDPGAEPDWAGVPECEQPENAATAQQTITADRPTPW
jgi:hypothetical protein